MIFRGLNLKELTTILHHYVSISMRVQEEKNEEEQERLLLSLAKELKDRSEEIENLVKTHHCSQCGASYHDFHSCHG